MAISLADHHDHRTQLESQSEATFRLLERTVRKVVRYWLNDTIWWSWWSTNQ